jgi:predicted phage-related endonuclease
MTTNELVTRIKEYREFKRMAEELLTLADSIADELKSVMLRTGQERMIVGEYKLSYTDVSRKDIDKKALAVEQEDIYNAYLRETVYKRFLVS